MSPNDSGIGECSLGNCVRRARVDRGERAGVTTTERDELMEVSPGTPGCGWSEIYSNANCGLLGEGIVTVTRYRWEAARKAEGFPITMAFEVAEVSRQAFGDWRARLRADFTALELCT